MKATSLENLLAYVHLDAPAMGVLGLGYQTSFYRVSVLINGQWWAFDRTVSPVRLKGRPSSPMDVQEGIPVENRADVVVGPLRQMLAYNNHPGKPALVALMSHVRELSARSGAPL